ncbi:MAG: GTP cyclohydrolase, partial [Eudoraea sp.]|nr:GTP cyclohydrolase [Eudoraea sp.]
MVTLKEVQSKSGLKQFVKFPFALYKNSPYWVPPIIKEEMDTFNKKVNPIFNDADARFFIAYKDGKVVGRIAAIINWIEVNQQKIRKMRFGWFDFIDDPDVSEALINKVVEIGKSQQLD